jgi:S1-C subfamily serine protease
MNQNGLHAIAFVMKSSESLCITETSMNRSLLCCAFLVAQLTVAVPYSASQDVAAVVKQSSDAVVLIVIADSTGTETALGSGFLVSPDGKVVTNYHVLSGAHSAIVKLSNGAMFPAAGVLAFDAEQDLAIVKVNGKNLPFLNLADINKLQVGDHVVAIGSPLGLEGTVSDGIISAVREEGHAKWIQTTAPVSHGNSGGPLLNMGGSVVGVITWGVSLQEGQNLNFAIPSAEVKAILSKSAALLPLDSIGRIRQTTPQPAATTAKTDKDQVQQEIMEGDGSKQHAIEQLRSIAEAIKKCPAGVDKGSDGFSESRHSAPVNVVWDVESTHSYRSPEIGYIEFISDSSYSLMKSLECKRSDRQCIARNQAIAETNAMVEALPTLRLHRYEFDFGLHGLEFSRALWRLESDQTGKWSPAGLLNSCEDVAVKTVLAAPVPQQPSAAVDVKQALTLYNANDYVEARPLLERACDMGNAEACNDLGEIYDSGYGIVQDHTKAAALFLKACNAGNVDSCLSLGVCYGNGSGVEQDYSRAKEFFSLSCDTGNSLGCAYLGDIYKDGRGSRKIINAR